MYIDDLILYCAQKKCVIQDMPFGSETLCFKVQGKMFLLLNIIHWESGDKRVNLKCDPIWAVELRELYQGIVPGFHMNKKHWNTVVISSDVPTELLFKMIDHSYLMVVQGLTNSQKLALEL